ncbi:MAG: hypothetical protein M5U15_06530 [Kiritimatiellae bacterium]|nr:hypothetical protein [Kiritimatiellia bacterium]
MKRFDFSCALAAVALMLSACQSPEMASAPSSRASRPVPRTTEAAAAVQRQAASQLPRVMLLVDEKNLGTIPTAEVEAMAIQMLLEQNVPVVDQDMVQSNLGKSQELLRMAGDNKGAAALGLQFGADIVIIGEVVAKPSARRISDSNLRSYQAAATLRAVRTDNSMALASASEDASIIGLDDVAGSAKAIKAAGKKCLDRLLPAMLSAWARSGGRSAQRLNHMTVTIGGVDQLWKLKAVREQLMSLKGQAVNVVQRNYTAGVAIFELDATVPSEELAETIVLNPPADIKFSALDIGSAHIQLKVTGN